MVSGRHHLAEPAVPFQVTETSLFIVMECGELDLARMLRKHKGGRLANENYLRLYWQQVRVLNVCSTGPDWQIWPHSRLLYLSPRVCKRALR